MAKIKYSKNNILTAFLNFKAIVLISNLIFQGIPYMTTGEKIYKVSITLIFTFIINFLLNNVYLSFLIGHIINYIINGQFYVVYRYLSKNETMNKEKLYSYITFIEKVTVFFKPLDIIYTGSFARGQMSRQSDLDIRIYHRQGIVNSLKCYFMATFLRLTAIFMKFPIDVYCFSNLSFLGPKKISKKEIPVHTNGKKEFLSKFPNSPKISDQLEKLIIR